MSNRLCALALGLLFALTGPTGATPIQWTLESGGNGNYYDLVRPSGGISWTSARVAAEASSYLGLPGRLATINSAEENDFVVTNLLAPAGTGLLTWIGLTDESSEGTFQWITGEPLTYINWQSGEPNTTANNAEDYVHYWTVFGGRPYAWNDLANNTRTLNTDMSYLVEYPVPEPSALVLLLLGALVAALHRRQKGQC